MWLDAAPPSWIVKSTRAHEIQTTSRKCFVQEPSLHVYMLVRQSLYQHIRQLRYVDIPGQKDAKYNAPVDDVSAGSVGRGGVIVFVHNLAGREMQKTDLFCSSTIHRI